VKGIGLSTQARATECITKQAFAPGHPKEWQTKRRKVNDKRELKRFRVAKGRDSKDKRQWEQEQSIETNNRIRMLVLRCHSVTLFPPTNKFRPRNLIDLSNLAISKLFTTIDNIKTKTNHCLKLFLPALGSGK